MIKKVSKPTGRAPTAQISELRQWISLVGRPGAAPIGGGVTYVTLDLLGLNKSIVAFDDKLGSDVFTGMMAAAVAAAALFFVVAQQTKLDADASVRNQQAANALGEDALADKYKSDRPTLERRAIELIDVCRIYMYSFMYAIAGISAYFGIYGIFQISDPTSGASFLSHFGIDSGNAAGLEAYSTSTFLVASLVSMTLASVIAIRIMTAMVTPKKPIST